MTAQTDTYDDLRKACYLLIMILEGEDYLLDDAYALTKRLGFTDEDGYWIYGDE